MRRWFWLSSLFLSSLLILAVIYAPAQLWQLLGQRYFPQLQLHELNGTLWKGYAERASWQIGDAALPLGKVYWHVNPETLLAEPEVHIRTEAQSHRFYGVVKPTADSVKVENGKGRFPLSLLEAWIPMLVSAEVELSLERIDYQNGQLTHLAGDLSADQVVWEVGDYRMPLGTYYADAVLHGDEVVMLIEDLDAYLGADAELRLSQHGDYRFKGTLEPRELLAPEIAVTLGWLGKRDDQGQIMINRIGRWK